MKQKTDDQTYCDSILKRANKIFTKAKNIFVVVQIKNSSFK